MPQNGVEKTPPRVKMPQTEGSLRGRNPELVILDCDGVLVDCELIANRILAELINELGTCVTPGICAGRSMTHFRVLVEGLIGHPGPDGFLETYRTRTDAAFTSELQAVAGVEHVLDFLEARRVEYCLSSNGSHEETHFKLGLTGLLPRLEGGRFSATDVNYAKPAPDVFLYAARHFGVAPSRCCVVEDTPTEVQAAVAAGMRVYGYCWRTPRHRLTDAGGHVPVDDLRKLPKLWFNEGAHPPT